MNENEFEEWMRSLIEECFDDGGVRKVFSFEEGSVMTRNRGLVVGFLDGSEFQVTIVKSKHGD